MTILARLFAAIRRPGTHRPGTINRPSSQMFPANFDALIARRSERVSNRDSATAAAYRRTHTILSEGRK